MPRHAGLFGYLLRWLRTSAGQTGQAKPNLHVSPAQFAKFKEELWDRLNQDAVLHYELDTPTLVNNIVQRMGGDFQVRPLTIPMPVPTTCRACNAQSTPSIYEVKSHTVFTLAGFVRGAGQRNQD